MLDYVKAWMKVLTDPAVTKATNGLFCVSEENDSQFLGTSLWSFSYQMTYPPMKWFDNEFLPGTPPDSVFDFFKIQPSPAANRVMHTGTIEWRLYGEG